MKKVYKGVKRKEICFPLGGIGTGSISLDGTGRFTDWEIFNRPSKGSINGYSHFGIKAEANGKTIDARVMNSDWLDSRVGRYVPHNGHNGYGYGPFRSQMCGMPHFRDCEFHGEFPLAEIRFIDNTFPGQVRLEAFNPFIPSNDRDSSIPAAFFTAEVTNTSNQTLTYTFELSVNNPSEGQHDNHVLHSTNFKGVQLTNDVIDNASHKYGSIIFGVPSKDDMQVQQYWYRGNWFDNLGIFWQDFTAPGRIKNRTYVSSEKSTEDIATIAVSATIAPAKPIGSVF